MSAVRRERARGLIAPDFYFSRAIRPRARSAILVLACCATLCSATARGTPPAQLSDLLEQQSFAAALDRAAQAPLNERDELYAQIAVAQAAAGQRGEFAATLDRITDEATRLQAARDGREHILAQFAPQPGLGPGNGFPGADPRPGGQVGINQGNANPGFGPPGLAGGAQTADFESLIELITSTIEPPSWDPLGGPGSVRPFPSGVLVDVDGLLRRLERREQATDDPQLARVQAIGANHAARAPDSPRAASTLRMVSLPRLERHLLRELAAGRAPDEAMLVLAGLTRVEYILLYPESGDLVLAGPASDWRRDACGRLVNTETGRPVVRLDDLVTVVRHVTLDQVPSFGCSIVPRQSGLAAAQEFANESGRRPLKPNERPAWLETLRQRLGRQDIVFDGIDPGSHAARAIIEADYHMKLIGTGLAAGTPGAPSYLELVERAGQPPASLDVLRWWFTLNYDALVATADRRAFALRGPAVQVLSESELLARDGRRIHTGQSEPLNREFAAGFTRDFAALAARYPVYAELANVFDLAVAAAVIHEANLAGRLDWHFGCLADRALLPLPVSFAPREVDTVANSITLNRRQIVAVVSGGVRVDPYRLLAELGLAGDSDGRVGRLHQAAVRPATVAADRWWWDADPAGLAATAN